MDECYPSLVNASHDITYPDIPSSVTPVPHSANDLLNENEGGNFKSEESYVGHPDEGKNNNHTL